MAEINVENERKANMVVGQEIEEEEVGHEWMDNPIEEVVIGQEDSNGYVEMEDDQLLHLYDDTDAYPSLLPIRDGIPLLTLNLPDLMSKTTVFTNGEKMILCFNKKCQRQIAFDGFLYTIAGYVTDTAWNTWTCINPDCDGSLRSSNNFQELRVRTEHMPQCMPDDAQIRLRVSIYDLRLMAEFTDLPLDVLHAGFESRMKNENPDLLELFPDFKMMKSTLDDHRINKIYRKRFEMQTLKDKQRKMNMTPDEVVYAESTSGMVRFRRTKAFPPSVCNDCGEQFVSTSLPSQDQLISHILYSHGRQLVTERFEFKDINLFEQYIRELVTYSKYKLKKFGLADENMYYLCNYDDRMARNGNGRARRTQEQNNHCSAFIRVFDWRIVAKKENAHVTIDYCLEHHDHPEHVSNLKDEVMDYYTPEVFLRDLDERRIRTAKLLEDGNLQRIKRPIEVRHLVPTGRLKPAFGSRSLAPPLAAQLAGGNHQPYIDAIYGESAANEEKKLFRHPIRAPLMKKPDDPSTSSASDDPSLELTQPQTALSLKSAWNSSQRNRITERPNFKDVYTFNAVSKVEDICMGIIKRLQGCAHTKIAQGYREKLSTILRKANADASLNDSWTYEDVDKSWVLSKMARGRPKKRVAGEEGDEEDEEEDGEGGIGGGVKNDVVEEEPTTSEAGVVVVENVHGSTNDEILNFGTTQNVESVPKVEEAVNQEEELPRKGRPRAKRARESSEKEATPTPTGSTPTSSVIGESRVGRPRKLPARLVE